MGGTVGSGIFVVPGLAAGLVGSTSLWAWGIVALSAFCTMLCLKWAGSQYPGTGAFYSIFYPVFGRTTATALVSLYFVSTIFGLATIAAGLGQYFLYLHLPHVFFLELGIILLFCLINIRGIRLSGFTENILTVLKIVPLFIIALALLPFISLSNILPFSPVNPPDFLRTILLVYWPFTGFEISAIPAEEVRDRNLIGRSLTLVMLIVVILYLCLNLSLIGSLGSEVLSNSPAPLATAAEYFIPRAGLFVALIGIIAMVSAMNAYLVGGSRVLQNLAQENRFPGISDLSRQGTPVIAILICSLLTVGLLLLTNRFAELAILSVITTLIPYLFISGATLTLFSRWRIRFIAMISLLMTAGILVLSWIG